MRTWLIYSSVPHQHNVFIPSILYHDTWRCVLFIARAGFVTAEISLSFSACMRQVYSFLLCAPEANIFFFPSLLFIARKLGNRGSFSFLLCAPDGNLFFFLLFTATGHFFSYLDFPTLTHTHSLSRSLSIFSHACFNKISLHALRMKPAQKHTPQSSVSHLVAILRFFTTPTHPSHF